MEAIDATVLLGIHTTLIQQDVMVRVICADRSKILKIYPGFLFMIALCDGRLS